MPQADAVGVTAAAVAGGSVIGLGTGTALAAAVTAPGAEVEHAEGPEHD